MNIDSIRKLILAIPIPWLIVFPFPRESRGTYGIPVFPIPVHITVHPSTSASRNQLVTTLQQEVKKRTQSETVKKEDASAVYR